MRLAIFMFVFILLVASASLAAGLKITEIDVNVDYDEAYTYRVDNRGRIDSASVPVANDSKINADVLPGSNVTFTVRIENTFESNGPDLRGVFVRTTIEEIDDGADLEDESIDFDLEPGDDYRFDVKFSIPIDVDAGTYNVIMEAEGEDKNGTLHTTELKLKLEVKKQSHDIRITKVLLSPSIVDCDRKIKLTAEIINAGSNAENQVALEFKSSNLGINSFDKDIALESSEEASEEEKTHTKTLSIEVPSFFNAGTYPIFINLYWKNFVLFDQKTVDLTVRDCGRAAKPEPKKEVEESKNETESVEVIQPKNETKETSKGVITATEEASIFDSIALLSILLGGFFIVILAIIIVVGFIKKGK